MRGPPNRGALRIPAMVRCAMEAHQVQERPADHPEKGQEGGGGGARLGANISLRV